MFIVICIHFTHHLEVHLTYLFIGDFFPREEEGIAGVWVEKEKGVLEGSLARQEGSKRVVLAYEHRLVPSHHLDFVFGVILKVEACETELDESIHYAAKHHSSLELASKKLLNHP